MSRSKHDDIFAELGAPFDQNEVKVRSQGGKQMHYITARTVMNRLDNVFGPDNWWDDYIPGENSVLCRLTVRLPDGSTLTKCDAGGYAGMSDHGDDDKSGYSDAFKRAAVKFGVARYLYRDGVPFFVQANTPPAPQRDPEPSGRHLPDPRQETGYQAPRERQAVGYDGGGYEGPPRTGKALFAWSKNMEQQHQVQMLRYLNTWAKLQEFSGRMVDWDGDQVAAAYEEGMRKLEEKLGPVTEEAGTRG